MGTVVSLPASRLDEATERLKEHLERFAQTAEPGELTPTIRRQIAVIRALQDQLADDLTLLIRSATEEQRGDLIPKLQRFLRHVDDVIALSEPAPHNAQVVDDPLKASFRGP